MKLTKREINDLLDLHKHEVKKHKENIRLFNLNVLTDSAYDQLLKKNMHLGRIEILKKLKKRLKNSKKGQKQP